MITIRNIAVATLIAYEDVLGDCSPVDLVSDVFIFCGVVAVFLRVWRLWFMYYSAVEKLDGEKWRIDSLQVCTDSSLLHYLRYMCPYPISSLTFQKFKF